MASFSTFRPCESPLIPTSILRLPRLTRNTAKSFPLFAMNQCLCGLQSSTVFQTEPAFGWKHKTPNLAGAVQRAQDAGGSGGVLIPTFEASFYSGNYILLQKSVPAAAGRYSLHFHLSKQSWEIRSLWRWLADPGGGFVQGTAAFQHWPSWAVSPGVCWAVCKELCLKKLYICKVLLSPHLFQSSTPVIVMRNQPHVPQSFSLVQA